MKPLIHYSDIAEMTCKVGRGCFLHAVNHPRINGWVLTSKVEKIVDSRPNGPVFETLNTIYAPAPTDETSPVPTYIAEKAP